MNKRFKAWFALGLITLVAGLMLSMTNEVTKDTIEQQKIGRTGASAQGCAARR